jgi:hypothetical protein
MSINNAFVDTVMPLSVHITQARWGMYVACKAYEIFCLPLSRWVTLWTNSIESD